MGACSSSEKPILKEKSLEELVHERKCEESKERKLMSKNIDFQVNSILALHTETNIENQLKKLYTNHNTRIHIGQLQIIRTVTRFTCNGQDSYLQLKKDAVEIIRKTIMERVNLIEKRISSGAYILFLKNENILNNKQWIIV
jgi:hypothetical protein